MSTTSADGHVHLARVQRVAHRRQRGHLDRGAQRLVERQCAAGQRAVGQPHGAQALAHLLRARAVAERATRGAGRPSLTAPGQRSPALNLRIPDPTRRRLNALAELAPDYAERSVDSFEAMVSSGRASSGPVSSPSIVGAKPGPMGAFRLLSRSSMSALIRVAAPMVGGLATSFILELLIYPVIYYIWKSRYELPRKIA